MDKEALAAFARKIISIPSYSGHEKDVADAIDDKMRELGFDEVRRVRYGSVIGCIHGSQPLRSSF